LSIYKEYKGEKQNFTEVSLIYAFFKELTIY